MTSPRIKTRRDGKLVSPTLKSYLSEEDFELIAQHHNDFLDPFPNAPAAPKQPSAAQLDDLTLAQAKQLLNRLSDERKRIATMSANISELERTIKSRLLGVERDDSLEPNPMLDPLR